MKYDLNNPPASAWYDEHGLSPWYKEADYHYRALSAELAEELATSNEALMRIFKIVDGD